MSDLTVEQQRDLLAQALLLSVQYHCYSVTAEDDGRTYCLHHGVAVNRNAFDVLVDCKLAEWASDSAIRLVDCDE